MIDIFNALYEKAALAVAAADLDVDMSSIHTDTPESFPHVSITEQDNSVYRPGVTLDNRENYARILIQVDVYSNKQTDRKSEAEAILSVIDDTFANCGFVRQSKLPTPNYYRGIYRITARYAGIVSKGQTSGNNTVYNIYNP